MCFWILHISIANFHALNLDRYYTTHQFTVKADIFSFGIVLLELIAGYSPISDEHFGADFHYIVEWVSFLITIDYPLLFCFTLSSNLLWKNSRDLPVSLRHKNADILHIRYKNMLCIKLNNLPCTI